MVKFKVYNMKFNISKFVKLLLILMIVVSLLNMIINVYKNYEIENSDLIGSSINKVSPEFLKSCFGKTLAVFSLNEYENSEEHDKIYISVKNILKYELGALNKIIEDEALKINEEELTEDDKAELLEYNEVETQVQDTFVEEKYSQEIQNVKIKNTSDYDITEEILQEAEKNDYTYSRNILIYHTHTCESYTQDEEYQYVATGNYRTTDLNYSVSRVGEELKNNLESLKFNVIHNQTYHDFPAYSGSYTRSYETVENELKENENYEIVFDIHRDAIGNDGAYAPLVKIGEEYAAQLMFVIGTDAGGLEHPEWKKNLSFAVKVQKKANELYPGLFKPIMISNSRFNQNLASGACIIEVGATGNTLKQAITSMKYLSIVLDNVI